MQIERREIDKKFYEYFFFLSIFLSENLKNILRV